MNEDKATRLLVSRSLTRKIGENFEKLIFQAEASLPGEFTLEQGFRDLDGTVVSALREAAELQTRPITLKVPQQEAASTEPSAKLIETITAADGKPVAQVFQQDCTLVAKVSRELRLPFQSAPIQSFLIPRVLDAMWNKKHIDNYEFQRTQDGFLTGIQIDLGGESGAEKRIKELTGAIAWTLKRLSEKRPGDTRN
jgi:hypothetical protein